MATSFSYVFPKNRRRCFLSSLKSAKFEISKYFAKKCWQQVYDQQYYSSRLRSIIYSLNGPASDDAIIRFENKIEYFCRIGFCTLRVHNGQHSKDVKVLDNIIIIVSEIDAYYHI